MKHACADVRYVNFVGSELERIHKFHGIFAASFDYKGNYAACSFEVFLSQSVVLVAFETGVRYALDLIGRLEILCDCESIGAIAFHADSECLQTEIKQECGMCGRIAAEVAHELHSGLDYVSHFSVCSGVRNAMV